MTLEELLAQASERLKSAGVENAARDARMLMEKCAGKSRSELFLRVSDEAGGMLAEKFRQAVEKRACGEPLQYILGEWGFMGGSYKVGPGVLIPRPETEQLAEAAVAEAPEGATVFDVCAGTGCIGISVAAARGDLNVFCVERYDDAFRYLAENIKAHGVHNVTAVKADMFAGAKDAGLPEPDMILSNPPYIKSGELAGLQREVLRAPQSALDGGRDGLVFFRALAEKWFLPLKSGGVLAAECGDGQAQAVRDIFLKVSSNITISRDLNGIERIVTVRKG